jgi:hypothetical protein
MLSVVTRACTADNGAGKQPTVALRVNWALRVDRQDGLHRPLQQALCSLGHEKLVSRLADESVRCTHLPLPHDAGMARIDIWILRRSVYRAAL